ncbi:hypothetical protein [Streptacidiphilus sp. EB129]|uniref:hypothetical protein n=1 Tax=Streptacidiphilus sp. EB129 TaxID=3156262 RepID=UPI003515599D
MDDHRGVATGPPGELRTRTLGAWDAVLDLAAALPAGPGGLGELAPLASWPERPVLARLLEQAEAALGAPTGPGAVPPGPAGGERVDHRGEGREAVLAALAEARERVAAGLDRIEARPELGLVPLDSVLGPLPLLTQVHATGHELALAALRCVPPGSVPEPVTEAGVAAMVDVVGALAWRQGVRTSAGVWGGGSSGWVFRSDATGWRTDSRAVVGADPAVPGVEGEAATVLGVPAGRSALPGLLARGELRLHRIGGLMALAPLVEQVPGLPGGALLRRAVGMVGLLGRLPGMR